MVAILISVSPCIDEAWYGFNWYSILVPDMKREQGSVLTHLLNSSLVAVEFFCDHGRPERSLFALEHFFYDRRCVHFLLSLLPLFVL